VVERAEGDLLERFARGERTACARLITLAEARDPRFAALYDRLAAQTGHAHRVGLTGPPGAGKSSVVDQLLRHWREADLGKIGVVAVDPSSPFSGGALLGDRVRMSSRLGDAQVFIRSMASRDAHGGLAHASVEACDVLDAWGAERVLLETVGVGQVEYEVSRVCDTTVVVLHPGSGDSVQAMKAGLLELAHVFAINKDDQPGGERLAADLEEMLELRSDLVRERALLGWKPPVLRVSAREGRGIEALAQAIDAHRRALESQGAFARARRERRAAHVRSLVEAALHARFFGSGRGTGELGAELERGLDAGEGPYALAARLVARVHGEERQP
jgi:LAO/AO transport system kinase